MPRGSLATSVDSITLQQQQGKKWKTIKSWKGVKDAVQISTLCGVITYHVEVGGEGSDPDHLDPGNYQFVVKLGSKKNSPTKVAGFKVGTCTFQKLSVRF